MAKERETRKSCLGTCGAVKKNTGSITGIDTRVWSLMYSLEYCIAHLHELLLKYYCALEYTAVLQSSLLFTATCTPTDVIHHAFRVLFYWHYTILWSVEKILWYHRRREVPNLEFFPTNTALQINVDQFFCPLSQSKLVHINTTTKLVNKE